MGDNRQSEFVMTEAAAHRGSLVLVNREHGWRHRPDEELGLAAVGGAGDQARLAHRAARCLEGLLAASGGWGKIAAVSGWRSYQEQQQIWQTTLAEQGEEFARQFVALPGHSEHETGLAVDLSLRLPEIDFIRPEFPYGGAAGRLRQQAAAWGFIQRYQAGKEAICGIAEEPWHFRFVGAPHAELINRLGLCLEEYLELLRAYPYGGGDCAGQGLPEAAALGWRVAFCSLAAGERLGLPAGAEISGNNGDGFVISWRAVGCE